MWEYLEVANFIIAAALLAFTIGILSMLRKADPELLRARLFLDKSFLNTTWAYILAAMVFITIHEISWLMHESFGIYYIAKTLFLLFFGILIAQWFSLAKSCMK